MDNKNNGSGGSKTCVDCKLELPLSDFHRNAKTGDGLQIRCKPCNRRNVLEWQRKFPWRVNAKNRKWKRQHADQCRAYNTEWQRRLPAEIRSARYRRSDLKRKYGVTPEWYDIKVLEQAGKCAICHEIPANGRRLAVDHNHTSGQTRGLLCATCNFALYKLEMRTGWVERAAAYLRSFGSGTTIS